MNEIDLLTDPTKFKSLYWPGTVTTDYQLEIIESVRDNKITVCVAGNKLGKDYIAAFIALQFFCSRVPARVLTSSVDGSQLTGVLWGEIRNFIQTAAFPLPLKVNHLLIRQRLPDGTHHGLSELLGRVVSQGEGLLGRHLPHGPNMEPRVLAIIDEASGFSDENFMGVDTWAHRILIIGNAFPCDNFFKRYVRGGDVKSDNPNLDYDVKIIKVPAVQSPNIQLALEEIRLGKEPSRRIIVPGCMDYDDYLYRRKTYDPIKAAAGLDAEFYEGEEVRMFPQEWLRISQDNGDELEKTDLKQRTDRRTMGIDTAEGGDDTVWTVVDKLGVIEQISQKTRNTAMIKGRTIALMKKHNIEEEDVLFDRGGGGREHADYLREQGYDVQSVGFGEAPTAADQFEAGWTPGYERKDLSEEKYAYKNKRAQLYGTLRQAIDPDRQLLGNHVFGIPRKYQELISQLEPIPLAYDGEGRMILPPKDKPTDTYKGMTIKKMLGRSPDQSDSLVLAVFALVFVPEMVEVGGLK